MASTALSVAEKNAIEVSYNVLGTEVKMDLDFVKNYLVRGRAELVSNQEIVMFMQTCKMQNLNPMAAGEVYFIKYSKDEPAQIVLGKSKYLRRMFENPDYITKKDGIVVQRGDQIVQKEGTCLYPGEVLIGGWCKVFFKRCGEKYDVFKEVSLAEYNKGMANWKSKPATMINKVAVSQCAREAFPSDYEGLYSEEEMLASGVIPNNPEDIPVQVLNEDGTPISAETVVAEEDKPIGQSERSKLWQFVKSNFGDDGEALMKDLCGRFGLASTSGMRMSVYNQIMAELEKINDARAETAGNAEVHEAPAE